MNPIEVTNLTKIFKTRALNKREITALDNVSINIEPGIIFGLLGPNGAGKTTLIKILLGIVHSTLGDAKIFGENVSNYKIRKRIGYLPENHKFPDYLTGEEVIVHYSKLNGLDINKNSSKIEEVLNLVKMNDWRKTKIKKYSKGMMQRLGLAQSIIHNPDLIFLDEPTDGVDPIGRKEIRDVLIDLKSQGKTLFINSHLLSEIELVSDKVAILNNGKLVKYGTVEELTVSKSYCEVITDSMLSEQLLSVLKNKYSIEYHENLITLEINDNTELNKFLDELRINNVNIQSVNQKKSTLEDMFINTLSDK